MCSSSCDGNLLDIFIKYSVVLYTIKVERILVGRTLSDVVGISLVRRTVYIDLTHIRVSV